MLLPRRHGEHTNYPTRRDNSFIPFKANSEKYRRSLIPESVRTWNNLNNYTRASTSLGQFKTSMRMQLFCKKIPFYSHFRGKSAVNHTQICLGLSPLRQHLYSYHIITSPDCESCEGESETPLHYLLRCPRYATKREELFQRLTVTVGRLGIEINNEYLILELLVNGHSYLTFDENISIFKSIHTFITDTNRF